MDWIKGLQMSIDYIEAHLPKLLTTNQLRHKAFRQAIIFSECLVFFADLPSASISETADCRLQARNSPQAMQK